MRNPGNLAFLDLEMTGLDPQRDAILQAALIITDRNLQPLDEYCCDVWQPESALELMSPFVRDMHEKNGLIARVRASRIDIRDAQRQMLSRVTALCRVPRRAVRQQHLGRSHVRRSPHAGPGRLPALPDDRRDLGAPARGPCARTGSAVREVARRRARRARRHPQLDRRAAPLPRCSRCAEVSSRSGCGGCRARSARAGRRARRRRRARRGTAARRSIRSGAR